ncbi:AraC family transcriptional regulator [Pelagicoccus sp. SDUM812005]|uniref:helix-turn-helix transcriptional regulator n=1 Tax=Pelagicoccus sp. SDUM812005 TaxID=3041257 RepID=UPI00280CBA44|nr:AraC family transcriptional regulator [Pelagicoccus sp. SDUM812005]MDQ8180870.1 AraC family transcriptional regulator [Pelagicoccus sp. SDUM812005]
MESSELAGNAELRSVVHYHQMPGTQPSPHPVVEGWQIVEVVTSGRGWVMHGGDWVEVRPGALLWHVEGDQTIGKSDPQEPYSCFAIRIQGVSGERPVPHLSSWPEVGEVVSLAEETIRMFLDEQFDRKVLLEYLYSKLRYESQLYEHRREVAGVPEPLRLVRSLIESRYAEPLKVEALASAAGWSVPHLHERFRSVFGTSPRQMILDCRLRSAREQLVGTGYSIKEVAANTGFTHSSAFCSAFRKATGMSPKAYRDAYYFG